MKILYLFTSARNNPGSVQNKVISQIEALNKLNCQCHGAFFTTDETNRIDTELYHFESVNKVEGKYFRSSRQKTAYHQAVYAFVKEVVNQYDYIYYRYPGAHPFLAKLVLRFPKKIFFEHITSETEEIKLYSKEKPLEASVSSILSFYEFYWKPLYFEKIFGNRIRQNALFGICNSESISNHEKSKYLNNYKTIVLGDAVEVSSYQIRPTPILSNELRIAFLKGAGTAAEFNGLDRIFKGIAEYKGPLKITFYLNGSNLESEKVLVRQLDIEQFVVFGGFVNKQTLDSLFNLIHLSFGALAVHRKGLESTTTIKTREYFARGMPFVFGHHDPDFSDNPEAMKYCMQVPANDEAINFEEIIEWFKSLEKIENLGENMHKFAVKNLDYKIKMQKLLEFIKQL